jgi:hypothetical protein
MSWHFLQEQEEASWAESSLDGAPSALSSLIPTAAGCYSPDSGTDSCRDSRSGTTSPRLTASRGADGSMSLAGDFHAPTLALPVEAQDYEARQAHCGTKWQGSLAKLCLVTFLWRTPQCLLFGDSTESLPILPRWGMMRDGELFPLPTLARDTKESASGSSPLWPTPITNPQKAAGNAGGSGGRKWAKQNGTHVEYSMIHPNFYESLMGWPINWTDSAPLATDKFQQWCDSHGIFWEAGDEQR